VALVLAELLGCAHGSRPRPADPACPDCADPGDAVRLSATQLQSRLGALGRQWSEVAARRPTPQQCDDFVQRYAVLADTEGKPVPAAQFNAGVVRETCGQPDRAGALYRRVLDDEDAPAKIRGAAANNLGVLAIDGGDLAGAKRWLERAVDLDPSAAEPRVNFAAALRRATDAGDDAAFASAEHQLQAALAVRSDDPSAFENLAELYYERGRDERSYLLLADLVITQGLRVMEARGRESAGLHNVRGLVLVERGEPVAAIRAFNAAVEIDGRHPQAHLNRAMIAIRLRDFATAQASLQVALDDPQWADDADAWLAMGVARRGQREYAEAEAAFQRAAQRKGGDPRALYNLGLLYSEHVGPGQETFDAAPYEKAKEYFSRFQRAAADRPDLRTAVADAKLRTRQIDELFEVIDAAEETRRQVEELEALERKSRAEEKQRLLELERRALERNRSPTAPGQ
jgi:tetratricopeptide (TPR) repeat protein